MDGANIEQGSVLGLYSHLRLICVCLNGATDCMNQMYANACHTVVNININKKKSIYHLDPLVLKSM